jgi:hypothetical protein
MSNLFKSKSQQTSASAFDPRIYGESLQNLQLAEQVAAMPFQAYRGPMVAPFTRDYMQGEAMTRGIASQGGYVPEIEQAARASQAALGFQPAAVQAGQVGTDFTSRDVGASLQGGPQNVQAGQVQTQFQAPTAQAAQFTDASLGQYMNPYQQGVIDVGLQDINRQDELARQQRAQRATASRAFGGSRAAIQEGIAAGEAARERNRFLAEQRSQGFQQAAQLRQSDVQLQQQAALANQAAQQQAQQMGFTGQQFNVGQGMQAQLANQQARQQFMQMGLTAEQANQAANMQAQQMGLGAQQFNVQQGMQAGLANQQAGLQGAQFRLGAAQQLGGLGQQALQNRYGAAQAMMGMGQSQQQLAQQMMNAQQQEFMRRQQYPLQQLAIRQGAVAAAPINQTVSTTQQSRPSYAQIGTQLASFAGSMGLPGFGSDMRMKTDVSKIKNPLDKINRLEGIEFEWEDGYGSQEGEDQGGERDMSVSAQDVEKVMPSAVSRRKDNMREVDVPQMIGLLTEAVKELDAKVSKKVRK